MPTVQFATRSVQQRPDSRLVWIQPQTGQISHLPVADLSQALQPGDLLVINNAATLPASLSGTHRASGAPIELRLAAALNPDWHDISRWRGFLFGSGDWRLPTEARLAIPPVKAGDWLDFACQLSARVESVSRRHGRDLRIRLTGEDSLWPKLYCAGKLIQYSYLEHELELWDSQTPFATCPAAVEPPSAAFPLRWQAILELRRNGIEIAALTHAAGISSTGEPQLDQLLPLPERYEIPPATAQAVNQAMEQSRRVIALGTSVTRALESAVDRRGRIVAGTGLSRLKMGPGFQRQIVSGLLTGMHESGGSHLQLLQSFLSAQLLERAYAQAGERGYLWHEFGDSCLIL